MTSGVQGSLFGVLYGPVQDSPVVQSNDRLTVLGLRGLILQLPSYLIRPDFRDQDLWDPEPVVVGIVLVGKLSATL